MRSVLIADLTSAAGRIAQALGEARYRVISAPDFDNAVAVANQRSFDFAVIELNLSGGSGFDLIRLLRSRSKRIRIVVTTAYASIASAQAALRAGADDLLSKPVSARQVVQALDAVADVCGSPTSCWMELDRARQVYIGETLADCTSIAEAARTLGLDRRSLKRMLTRYGFARKRLGRELPSPTGVSKGE